MDVERIHAEKLLKKWLDSGEESFSREEVVGLYELIRRKSYPEPDFVLSERVEVPGERVEFLNVE